MAFDFVNLLFLSEVHNLDVARLFVGTRKYASVFLDGNTHQAQWILASDERVGQIQMLEIVDVYLGLKNNDDAVLPELDV